MSQPTPLQSAAAALIDVLTNAEKKGARRVWLGNDGARALQDLADLSDPEKQFEKVTAALDSAVASQFPSAGPVVHGSGGPVARILLIGDQPSADDVSAGQPFSGAVGAKLNGILKAMGLSLDDVHRTLVMKVQPTDESDKQTIIDLCEPVLQGEINLIQPDLVVIFGEAALAALTATDNASPPQRGTITQIAGVPTLPTAHPSVILESEADSPDTAIRTKRAFWEDMLTAMEFLKMPISAKQRGFFTR